MAAPAAAGAQTIAARLRSGRADLERDRRLAVLPAGVRASACPTRWSRSRVTPRTRRRVRTRRARSRASPTRTPDCTRSRSLLRRCARRACACSSTTPRSSRARSVLTRRDTRSTGHRRPTRLTHHRRRLTVRTSRTSPTTTSCLPRGPLSHRCSRTWTHTCSPTRPTPPISPTRPCRGRTTSGRGT